MLRSNYIIKVIFTGVFTISLYPIFAQTWLSGYEFRKEIILDGTEISGTHSDFPLLFELASDTDLAADARSDGYDIVFTDAAGITQLNHELISN